MTVTTTTSRISYAGNGVTTAFSVPFYFLAAADLVVIRTTATGTTTLVLNTDYTVTGAGVPAGGTVTCTVAPTVGQSLVIFRAPAETQTTDYQPNDPFPAETHERALDKLTMIAQRLKDLISRSFTLSDGDTSGASTQLPTPQANRLIGWNTSANGLQNVDPSSLLTIAGSSGFSTQTFNGTGAQTAFTLSANPGAIANLEVFVGGVRQTPTTNYTVSGTTLTFFVAPAAGTNNILARWGQTLGIGVPSDTSVSTVKIADDAVTTAKILNDAVTTAKILNDAVTTPKIVNDAVTTAKIANNAVTLAKTTMSTSRLLGRTTAGSGAAEEIQASAPLSLSAGALSVTAATTSATGAVQLATAAEVQAGTDANKAVTPSTLRASGLVRATAQASTSGTVVDFTGIPSWAKRIVVMLVGVSTNGSTRLIVQIGTSGGIESTGYTSGAQIGVAVAGQFTTETTGFVLEPTSAATATAGRHGSVVIENVTSNTWVSRSNVHQDTPLCVSSGAGSKSLSGVLDRVRITTVAAADTFDAGTINIMYE